MSSEVIKKRGRPRKVSLDPSALETAEAIKKTTGRTAATPSKLSSGTTRTSESTSSVRKPRRRAAAAASSMTTPTPLPNPAAAKSPTTASPSAILNALHNRTSNSPPPPPPPASSPTSLLQNPTPLSYKPTAPLSSSTPPRAKPTSKTTGPLPSTPSSTSPPPSPPPEAKPTPVRPPISALNASIVSQISARAGARSSAAAADRRELPPNYKPVARKVTLVIVALPIAVVTSWVLYQRLVKGEERKLLVQPAPTMGEIEDASARQEGGGKPLGRVD
ncbi:MAG: hypothetical protein M1818_007459 [Claussenomyces sp. TS43310]|nr:MAG: hypothetical protein M1818_007459 [Claussenomyces sp. TS43310]